MITTIIAIAILCLTVAALVQLGDIRQDNRANAARLAALDEAVARLRQDGARSPEFADGVYLQPSPAQTASAAAPVWQPPAPTPAPASAPMTGPDPMPAPASAPTAMPYMAPTPAATPNPSHAPASRPPTLQPAPAQAFAYRQTPASAPVTGTPANSAVQHPAVPHPGAPHPAMAYASTAAPYASTAAPYASAPAPSVERVIGRSIFPFLAAGMVFIGLVFLAILVVPTMNQETRFASMLAISATLFGLGFFLARRSPSTFSIALLGTGVGALFISILMARVHFRYLPDAPAFALLLAWLAGAMALVKLFDSLTLSVTAHAGMAISLFFAFMLGFDTAGAPLVLGYQLAASALVIASGLYLYRRTYRLGLAVALVMTLFASLAIGFNLWDPHAMATNIASYLIQFATASVLSFLLAMSTAKIADGSKMAWHVGNKLTWTLVTLLALQEGVSLLSFAHFDGDWTEHIGALACIVAFLAHAALSLALERGGHLPAPMARFSAIGALSLAALMRIWDAGWASSASLASVPALFIVALVAMGAARALGEREYAILALALLGFDAALALLFPHRLAAVQLGWSVAIMATGAVAYALWPTRPWPSNGQGRKHLPTLLLAELVFFETVVVSALARVLGPAGNAACLVLAVGVLAVLRAANIERMLEMTRQHFTGFAVIEYLTSLFAVAAIGLGDFATAPERALGWIAAALLAVMSLLRILQVREPRAYGSAPIQVLSSAILAFTVQAAVSSLVPLGPATPFAASVAAILTAFVLVSTGFALRLRPVRLFGLGLAILAVLKLALFDVASISSIGRVLAFIAGGLIIFAISALYALADKRLAGGAAGLAAPGGAAPFQPAATAPAQPTAPAQSQSAAWPPAPAQPAATVPAQPQSAVWPPAAGGAAPHNFGPAAF